VQTAHGGELLLANDTWFAPTDITLGPDGAVYVADWHDARMAHPDPDAAWDRSNGRIYRIAARGTPKPAAIDFAELSADELVKLHQHRSQWYVRHARQELVRRFASSSASAAADATPLAEADRLRRVFREAAVVSADEVAALEALWTLVVLRGFDEALAAELLGSPHSAVRAWTVRILCDGERISPEMAQRLDDFAEREPSVIVRQQLAASAARLPAAQALPVINANINRDLDIDDPYMPLLWWWAVEKHSVTGREEVLRRFTRSTLWKSRLGRDVLLTRLIRRYAAEGTTAGLDAAVRLLQAAPDDRARNALWPHVLLGWRERPRTSDSTPGVQAVQEHALSQLLLTAWRADPGNVTLLQLGVVLRHQEPLAAAVREAFHPQTAATRRVELLGMLTSSGDAALVEPALTLIESEQPAAVRLAALQVLAQFDDPRVIAKLIAVHRTSDSDPLKSQIRAVLLARPTSAKAWLSAVERGEVPAAATPLEQIRRVALLADSQLDALVAKHWGKLQGSTREEKLAEVRRLNNDLRAGGGDAAAGRQLFLKHCAACHQLFGEGKRVGPDLTTANRQDREFLLTSLVDPNSVIRKEFVSVVLRTTNGRVLTGLPISSSDAAVTLVNVQGEPQVVATADIDKLLDSPVSLMPENLYQQLKPQELRDLFAFLQSKP